MEMTPQNIKELLRLTANTADHELTCDESGELVDRYIEFRVYGSGPLPGDLKGVEQHLGVCPDCVEVIEAAIEAVRAEGAKGISGQRD